MSDDLDEILVEQAAGAYRARDVLGRVVFHPAWHDLDPLGRARASTLAVHLRRLEAALDAEGLSSTGRAVLARIR